jgi:acetyltransferase-like isoleucine patch superfamily enzyme
LGGSVQVTDGVTIGSCCMIGTGAIVMADIPEYSVYMPRPGMIMGKTTRED